MTFNSMTDQAVALQLGQRIEQLRLEHNMTQQAVADEVGISRISYRRLEAGEAKLVNVIAVLRVLGQLSLLEKAIPEVVFSPMEQLKLQGKQRKRATGKRPKNSDSDETDSPTNDAKTGPINSRLDW